jgi:primosomal protein N' (replication factor Y)
MKYVDVILPLPLAATFTYSVPDEWSDRVRIGMRVVVPFGKKKMYTAIIYLIHSITPSVYEAKEILFLMDDAPIMRFPQMKFWDWVSSYYQACLGDVYQAAIPAGLKLESETKVCLNPDFEAESLLSEKEERILMCMADGKPQTVTELSKLAGIRDVMPTLNKLLGKGAVEINEELAEKFRAKTEMFVKIAQESLQEDNLKRIFDDLSRAKKQLDVLMKYIELSKCLVPNKLQEVSRKELLEKSGASSAVLAGLLERDVLQIYKKEIGRLNLTDVQTSSLYPLNPFQAEAYVEIEKQFLDKSVVLLHGVTSSGKTELYIHLINKVLAEGKQVLYLVPEIALTTQLTTRLKRVFGKRLGVYHSKFSDAYNF